MNPAQSVDASETRLQPRARRPLDSRRTWGALNSRRALSSRRSRWSRRARRTLWPSVASAGTLRENAAHYIGQGFGAGEERPVRNVVDIGLSDGAVKRILDGRQDDAVSISAIRAALDGFLKQIATISGCHADNRDTPRNRRAIAIEADVQVRSILADRDTGGLSADSHRRRDYIRQVQFESML